MEQLIRDMGNLFCPRPVEAHLHQHDLPGIQVCTPPGKLPPVPFEPPNEVIAEGGSMPGGGLINCPVGRTALQSAAHGRSDDGGEHWWNRVAYLPIPAGRVAGEPEAVRKRLDSGRLPDGQCAVLPGVDVPVSVLGDVGGNTSASAGRESRGAGSKRSANGRL